MKKILIDSGPLIALFDASDKFHDKTIHFIKENNYPLITTLASVTETLHLLDFNRNAQIDFIEWVYRGGVEIVPIDNADFARIKKLTEKYTPELVEEITNVPVDKLEKAAHIYGNSKRAMIATGMGMSQEITGVNNVYSLVNMCLITGNIGRKGAGINPPRGQNNVQGVSDVGCLPNIYPGYLNVADDDNRKKMAQLWNVDYNSLPSKAFQLS